MDKRSVKRAGKITIVFISVFLSKEHHSVRLSGQNTPHISYSKNGAPDTQERVICPGFGDQKDH